jgi:phasin
VAANRLVDTAACFPKETMMAQAKTKTESAAEAAFDPSRFEVPAAMRDFAEKGAAQAKDAYTKFKVVADEASDVIEGAYSSASRGASTLGLKALETARVNTNATFDHAIALFGVKSLSDAIELNTAFMRKQAETMTAQVREFGELTQKVVADAAAPVRAQLEKSMKFPL